MQEMAVSLFPGWHFEEIKLQIIASAATQAAGAHVLVNVMLRVVLSILRLIPHLGDTEARLLATLMISPKA